MNHKPLRDFSAEFNALPIEIRTIGSGLSTLHRIRDLKMEKDRLKQNYEADIREINDRIKMYERHLYDLSKKPNP